MHGTWCATLRGPARYLRHRPEDTVLYRIAVGPIAGREMLRLRVPGAAATQGESAKPLTATRDGFSLNAAAA
jgi:hypothetical protein